MAISTELEHTAHSSPFPLNDSSATNVTSEHQISVLSPEHHNSVPASTAQSEQRQLNLSKEHTENGDQSDLPESSCDPIQECTHRPANPFWEKIVISWGPQSPSRREDLNQRRWTLANLRLLWLIMLQETITIYLPTRCTFCLLNSSVGLNQIIKNIQWSIKSWWERIGIFFFECLGCMVW